MADVVRDQYQGTAQGDRGDPQVRFVERLGFRLERSAQGSVALGGGIVEGEYRDRVREQPANTVGKRRGSSLRGAVEEFSVRGSSGFRVDEGGWRSRREGQQGYRGAMRDKDLYARILKIEDPWRVAAVEVNLEQGEVVVHVEHDGRR